MIQTGHANCHSTDDERKIWANLIYSLKQRTRKKVRMDHSGVDEEEPLIPTCNCTRDEEDVFDMRCESLDRENSYMYRVEAYNQNNVLIGESDDREIDLIGVVSNYVYHLNNSPTMDKDTLLGKQTMSMDGTIRAKYTEGQYIHITAVDESGNASPVLSFSIQAKCRLLPGTDSFFQIDKLKGRTSFWFSALVFSTTRF